MFHAAPHPTLKNTTYTNSMTVSGVRKKLYYCVGGNAAALAVAIAPAPPVAPVVEGGAAGPFSL